MLKGRSYQVLHALKEKPLSVGDIALKMGISKQHLSSLVRELNSNQFLDFKFSSIDGRMRIYFMTSLGKTELSKVEDAGLD